MVLDNADDLRLFGVGRGGEGTKDDSLYPYIPQHSRGTILWTSRDQYITGTLVGARRGLEVRAMTDDEATLLLKRARGKSSAAEAEGLAGLLEELQRLPLAISQAGAYMRRTFMTIEEYLGLLRQGKSRWEVLKMHSFDRHRRLAISNSVLETYKISIERIREESEMSYRILHVIAYMSSQDIPYELIMAAGRANADKEEEDGEQITDLEVQKAASRLQEFSFLSMLRKEGRERSYDMHKLVQEAVRHGVREAGQVKADTASAREVERKQSQFEAYYARMALRVVDYNFPKPEPKSWGRCEQYLPHAIEVSNWAVVADMRNETAALLSKVSAFLSDRGRWWEREPVDMRTLEIRREVLGAEHPDTLSSLRSLATTYRETGRWVEAEMLGVQVLETAQRVLGPEHEITCCSMTNLALTYNSQGRWKEAEKLHDEVLAIRKRILGAEHPDTLRTIHNLASIYSRQRRWTEAETLHAVVIEMSQRIHGAEHPRTLRSMGNLVETYREQGRYAKAETLQMEVIKTKQQVLGAEHPDTLRSLGNLANSYNAQAQYQEAEILNVQVLGLKQRALGAEHPDTLHSMSNLATTYHGQARYQEAEALRKEVYQLRRRILGDAHPDTARSMRRLAQTQACLRQNEVSPDPHRQWNIMQDIGFGGSEILSHQPH